MWLGVGVGVITPPPVAKSRKREFGLVKKKFAKKKGYYLIKKGNETETENENINFFNIHLRCEAWYITRGQYVSEVCTQGQPAVDQYILACVLNDDWNFENVVLWEATVEWGWVNRTPKGIMTEEWNITRHYKNCMSKSSLSEKSTSQDIIWNIPLSNERWGIKHKRNLKWGWRKRTHI